MHALTLHAPGDLRHESVPDPHLQLPTDAVVRVTHSAICGSDLHAYHGREVGLDPGTVVGHEFVGEIVEVGAEVSGLAAGDRVVGAFSTSCGECTACKRGLTARCAAGGDVFGWVSGGVGLPGAQAQCIRVPLASGTLVSVPPELDSERALFAGDVLSTGLFCAESGGAAPGSVVAVLGAGPVGLMAVAAARALGAERILCIDRVRERLALAEQFGAQPIDLDAANVPELVRAASAGEGVDAVLEAVGSEAATQLAYELARPGGTIAAAGVHNEARFAITPGELYDKNLTYRAGRCPARALMKRSFDLLASGRVDPSPMISHRLPLAEGPRAYEIFAERADGCTKVVLEP